MAQPSKIMYIVTRSEMGGAQRYVFDLASSFKAKGYKVAIAAGNNGPLLHQADSHGIKIYPLRILVREINPVKDLLAYWEIKKLIKEFKPDILHLNSSKAGVLGALAGKKLVQKIIYTVHGFVFNEPLSFWKKWLYLFAEKYSARHKDALICVSEFDRQEGIKNKIASAEKLITIHNGISTIDFLSKDEAIAKLISSSKFQVPSSKPIIATIANLYPTKGLPYLIAAARQVRQQKPQVIFAVIGEGRLRPELENTIKKYDLEKNFILLGNIPKAAIYLKAFDIFVLPSVKEGLPYTILEAMQAGLPIVATHVGGVPEIITDQKNGLLVESKKPPVLAEAIITLIKDKDLVQRLGNQALTDVADKFSLAAMVEKTEEIYHLK